MKHQTIAEAALEAAQYLSPSDAINPEHYKSGSVEAIDAMESCMTPEAFCGYCKGNAMKYLWRYENKGGVEDLRKAQWYLDRLITSITREDDEQRN